MLEPIRSVNRKSSRGLKSYKFDNAMLDFDFQYMPYQFEPIPYQLEAMNVDIDGYILTENTKKYYKHLYATDSILANSIIESVKDSHIFSKDIFLSDFFRFIRHRKPNIREEVYSAIINETKDYYSGQATIDCLTFANDIVSHFGSLFSKNKSVLNDIWFEAYNLLYFLFFEASNIVSYIKGCFAERIFFNEILSLLQIKQHCIQCCSLWSSLFEYFDLISTGKFDNYDTLFIDHFSVSSLKSNLANENKKSNSFRNLNLAC